MYMTNFRADTWRELLMLWQPGMQCTLLLLMDCRTVWGSRLLCMLSSHVLQTSGPCSMMAQVVCTIHQPNSDITERFDDLLLLASGRVVYFGAWADAVEHFAQLGYP